MPDIADPPHPTDVHPEIFRRHAPLLFLALLQQVGQRERDDLIDDLKSRTGWRLERLPDRAAKRLLQQMAADGLVKESLNPAGRGRHRYFYLLRGKGGTALRKELSGITSLSEATLYDKLESDMDSPSDPPEWACFCRGAVPVLQPTFADLRRHRSD